MKDHLRVHTGEKPFKCDTYGLCFAARANLKKHLRTHTREKPFKCDTCGLCFTRNGSLTDHMRIHTGEKPFKCDTCLLRFTKRGTLWDHNYAYPYRRETIQKICYIWIMFYSELKFEISSVHSYRGESIHM